GVTSPLRDAVRTGWRHASTAKLENCQSSLSGTAGVPHFEKRRERLCSGVQSVCTDGQGPRYGLAASRVSWNGKASGTRIPLVGFLIIHTNPPITAAAT